MSWLLAERFQHADPLVVEAFTKEVARLAFEADPVAFIAAGVNSEAISERPSGELPLYREQLHERAVADPDRILALARGMENAEIRGACFKELALVWAESNPDGFFRVIAEMPQADLELLHGLEAAAAGNEDELLDRLGSVSDPWRRLLKAAAMVVKAEKNPLDALNWLTEQEDADGVISLLYQADATAWGGREKMERFLGSVVSVTEQLPDGALGKMSNFGRLFRRMETYSPEVCIRMDLVRLGIPPTEAGHWKISLVQTLSLEEPAAVADVYQHELRLGLNERREIARCWIRAAAQERVAIPQSLLDVMDPTVRKEAEMQMERLKHPKPAVSPPTIAEQLDASAGDSDSYGFSFPRDLMRPVSEAAMDEAVNWAHDLSDEQIPSVYQRLVHTGSPPPQVADIVFARAIELGLMSDKDMIDWTDQMSNRAWSNPADTAQALNGYPMGRARNQALQNVALRWHEHDPRGAALWMGQLSEDDRQVAADAIQRGEAWERQSEGH
ncbi:hypothetical protein HNR46_001897 [Haloferula luteola]|uniref:Uncharacterized protein n=1 Tax=Haloferula luteola TaxID=595692 RepID=A0A840VAE8_9BACT|nr:hypothetical protein [Haloferula luteola]MBB5351658.1 hypothetical protein [Haloferula luteola]